MKQVSQRLRFQILARDGFRCCYCGATPKQAQLHVDHVHPRSHGGTNEPSNLVTACTDCNLGKADVLLPKPVNHPTLMNPVSYRIETILRRTRLFIRLREAGEMN